MGFTGNLQTEQTLSYYYYAIYYGKGLKDLGPSNTKCTLKSRSFLASIKIFFVKRRPNEKVGFLILYEIFLECCYLIQGLNLYHQVGNLRERAQIQGLLGT